MRQSDYFTLHAVRRSQPDNARTTTARAEYTCMSVMYLAEDVRGLVSARECAAARRCVRVLFPAILNRAASAVGVLQTLSLRCFRFKHADKESGAPTERVEAALADEGDGACALTTRENAQLRPWHTCSPTLKGVRRRCAAWRVTPYAAERRTELSSTRRACQRVALVLRITAS